MFQPRTNTEIYISRIFSNLEPILKCIFPEYMFQPRTNTEIFISRICSNLEQKLKYIFPEYGSSW